jgi:hypothetical protein
LIFALLENVIYRGLWLLLEAALSMQGFSSLIVGALTLEAFGKKA